MSTFEQIQRKSSTISTRAASTSRRLRSSGSFPASLPEQVSPDEQMQSASGRSLQHSLAHIPISAPERENQAGLPVRLKAGIEHLSGLAMGDVHVHYNSPQPASIGNTLAAGSHGAPSSNTVTQTRALMPGSSVVQFAKKKRKQETTPDEESEKKQKTQQPTEVANALIEQPQELPAPQNVPDTSIAQPEELQLTPITIPISHSQQSMEISEPLPEFQQSSVVAQQSMNPQPTVDPLSRELQEELQEASKTEDQKKRQAALENVSTFIQKQNVVKLNLDKSDPPITLKIRYSIAKKEQNKLADTQYKSTGKGKKGKKGKSQVKVTITIAAYSGLFKKPPEAIYSALYHEFIHAAQRTLETDEKGAEATDEYMYEPQNPTAFDKEILKPLQEIETHVWEIEHADETGIAKNATDYYRETWLYLLGYTRGLLKLISTNDTKSTARLPFWKGYIERAIRLLKQLASSSAQRIKDDLQKNDTDVKNTTNEKELNDLVGKIEAVHNTISPP